MRIVVTGATGFLGSYLVADLLRRGHVVAIVTRPDGDAWRLREYKGAFAVICGTLADPTSLRGPLAAFRPDAVAHVAWAEVAGADRNSPAQARNIAMTVELAAVAADIGVRAFVGAGSQAEYGPHPHIIGTDDATRPTSLYGHAKLAAGAMAGQVAAERQMRFAWLRIFSTYGPKDNPTWLIPSTIARLRSGQRMSLTGCGQRWGFLHAADAAAAFRVVIEDQRAAGIFNLGSPDAPVLRDTVTLLRDLVDSTAELGFGDLPYRPDQVMHLQADVTGLTALGWRPQVVLADGLRETVAWYVGGDAR
jgi:nucleoside-diphosphate-sugar epimerase